MDPRDEPILAWIGKDLGNCALCLRPAGAVRRVVEGRGALVCDTCVLAAAELLYRADLGWAGRRGPTVVRLGGTSACAVCLALVETGEAVRLPGRRGPLCHECVEAAADAARSLTTSDVAQ